MNVVVTGGGTIAPIDDVRHIANTSTGRFSAEITEAFLGRGATVWHVHASTAILPLAGHDSPSLICRDIKPGTVADYSRVLREVLIENPIDIAILAMAASDYEPERIAGKVPSDRDEWTLTLRRVPKVIRSVRGWSPRVFLVGFKLLYGVSDAVLIATARDACATNDADLTIANDLQAMQRGEHAVHVVNRRGLIETIGPGGIVADRLVERILAEFRARRQPGASP
jgi:phosphopantothenate---cysteine ligase (CTP)